MSNAPSSYEIDLAMARRLRDQTLHFTLAPELWEKLDIPHNLSWRKVPFDVTPVSQIPNNQIGVYAFVLEPDIANLGLSYLLYVGKTIDNFRARYGKYKSDQKSDKPKRYLVKQMLTAWPGRIVFCYAAIANQDAVTTAEDALIAAFKPPVCLQYPAKVREPFKLLDLQV